MRYGHLLHRPLNATEPMMQQVNKIVRPDPLLRGDDEMMPTKL